MKPTASGGRKRSFIVDSYAAGLLNIIAKGRDRQRVIAAGYDAQAPCRTCLRIIDSEASA